MNPRIRILPAASANGFHGGLMSGQRPGKLLVLMMETYP